MSEEGCVPTGEKTIIFVNALFHSTILFTFLAVFYMVYGSKVETKASNENFANLVSSNLKKILEKGNKETNGDLKRGLEILDPIWDVLDRQYQGEDTTVETYNTWLFRSATMIAAFMLIALGIVIIVLKFSCGNCPTEFIWGILRENAIIFAGIGAVEYLFFTNVALKMIPAPPSLMVNQVVDKIKNGIF